MLRLQHRRRIEVYTLSFGNWINGASVCLGFPGSHPKGLQLKDNFMQMLLNRMGRFYHKHVTLHLMKNVISKRCVQRILGERTTSVSGGPRETLAAQTIQG
jgi:hypothetical protein